MVNKIVLKIIDRWKNEEPPKPRERKPVSSGLTQILQRDENGKPKLDLNPIEKTAVSTPTQKSYWDLMRVYECGGWKWKDSGSLPTQYNAWRDEGKKTCITAGVDYPKGGVYDGGKFRYGTRGFYQGKGWDVISTHSTQEFYDKQNITPEMLKEINEWFDKNGK